jgi:N-acetylglucosaminyl-diphospho-decaprenol L-rhamnosyltransferase
VSYPGILILPNFSGNSKKINIIMNLDVIVVNWNAGNQLLECLQSLSLACQGSIFHLSKYIVVDNASTDDSVDQLEACLFPVTIIKNRQNKGFAYACNQGAKAGEAEFILFLNPDVRLFPDSLDKALVFMAEPENEDVGIVGIQLVDQQGIIQRNVARFPTPKSFFYQMFGLDRLWPKQYPTHFMTDWDHRESREVDQVQGSFFLVRRKIFDELLGFDERFFMYYEDLDFALRTKQAGWKVYYLANVQSFHQGGGTSHQVKARRLFYVLRSRAQYAAKHFGFRTALKIIIVSVGIELWVRLGWSLINFSGKAFVETLQAYMMFSREIPRLLKNLKNG